MKRADRRKAARRACKEQGIPFRALWPRMRQAGARQPFKRIIALIGDVNAAEDTAALGEAMRMSHLYKSRGKGRGSLEHRHGNKPGKYMPHQGARECERRARPCGIIDDIA
jgi:hypothetical protein